MTISTLLKNGTSIGFKNLFPLIGTLTLYIVTIWIPYINVGTTIALYTLPASMSRGETISPTHIFDSKYRENMGNFFIILGLMSSGIFTGFLFMAIPGFILMLTWILALPLLVDKGLNPMQALHESNLKTLGHKLTIFFTFLVSYIICIVTIFLLAALLMLAGLEYGVLASILLLMIYIIVLVIYFAIQLGVMAEIYKQLVLDAEKK